MFLISFPCVNQHILDGYIEMHRNLLNLSNTEIISSALRWALAKNATMDIVGETMLRLIRAGGGRFTIIIISGGLSYQKVEITWEQLQGAFCSLARNII